MPSQKILRPDRKSVRKLQQQCGEQSVCARARDNAQRGVRRRAIELIAETIPREIAQQSAVPETIVGVKVAWQEAAVQKIVRQAGERWNCECRGNCLRLAKKQGLEAGIDLATLPGNKITRPAGKNPGQGHGYRQA